MKFFKHYISVFSNKYLAYLLTLIIFILCTIPSDRIPLAENIWDKSAHFIAFGAWTFCWQFAFGNYVRTILIGIIYGICIEFWQDNLPENFHRGFDWYDALADGIGVFIGIILFKLQDLLFNSIKKA